MEIQEPHDLANMHFARQEAAYQKSIEGRFCKECGHCFVNEYPHVDIPNKLINMVCEQWEQRIKIASIVENVIHRTAQNCAWCDYYLDFVSANDSVSYIECPCFEPARNRVVS